MNLETQIEIDAPKEAVWAVITDFAHAADNIQGIQEVEILEQPVGSLVGLKWKETRVMFGKTATEVMWITEAVENAHYITRAESHGFIYISAMRVEDHGSGCLLTMAHDSQAQGFMGKVIGVPMGLVFKGMMKKVLLKDLTDIKAVVERGQAG
ncbi:MAG: carbon monoxide dehydrogenase subunit G [Bacteroidia bacterium]|jgi:carbon monoxide dehydrogenase subunit G